MTRSPLRVVALAASSQLGGTERVLLDFAAHAFEHDVALRVLTPRPGPLIDILNQAGVPADVVPAPEAMLRGSQQPGRLWSALPAAMALPMWARALRGHPFCEDAHVLYSIGFKTHLATTFPMKKRVVWHLHEFPPQTTGRIWKWLARRLPHLLIANSQTVACEWGRGKREEGRGKAAMASGGAGIGERRVEGGTLPPSPFPLPLLVIPNGVDLDRFTPRPRTGWIHRELNIPGGARLIGMPAVFARWKGQQEVIEAFREIAAEFPDTHLVLVGGSIYDTVAERRFGIDLIRLTGERIHILPFQSRIELAYPEFEFAVHYSLRPEPFGRVVLEAMACATPVIAANEGGPTEILGQIRDTGGKREEGRGKGKSQAIGGWLVPPRAPAVLADALRTALSEPRERLAAMGQMGRVRAEDHFSSRRFARRIADALRQAFG